MSHYKNEFCRLTRKALQMIISKSEVACSFCGEKLYGVCLKSYPHSGGFRLEDDREKQWYFLHCDFCRYDTAIWKVAKELRGLNDSL